MYVLNFMEEKERFKEMEKKKLFVFLLTMIMVCTLFLTGCGGNSNGEDGDNSTLVIAIQEEVEGTDIQQIGWENVVHALIYSPLVTFNDELDEVTGQVMKFQVVFTQGAPSELYNRNDVIHMSNVGSVYTVIVPKSSDAFPEDMKSLGAVLVEEMPVGLEESFVYMNKNNIGGEENA